MTEALTLFEGNEIRTLEQNGDIWLPVVDLAEAWKIARNTVSEIIDRNQRLFDGYTTLVHVTCTSKDAGKENLNASLRCVNEQGLYLLMGRINTERLKDPNAKETILRFQRWVPELVKAFRKGELKPSKEIEAMVRSHLNIADAMVQYAHVDRGIMTTVALARVESETGADLSWLKGLVRKDRQQPPGYLNAGQVGEELGGLSANSVNKILAQLGYQYWMVDRWQPTLIGMNYGENMPYTVINKNGSSHSGYQLRWSPMMVARLRSHIDGTAQIERATGARV
jgi:prophage antirepressor-like protein